MTTSVFSVPANRGISVKNEHDDPKINAMALKMKDNYQKNASAPVKQTFVIVPTTTSNNTQKNNQEQLHNNCEDVYSIKGRFSWKLIARYEVPYIIRVINGEKLKFVSIRMVETQLLSNYLHYLHADMYTCTSVKSHFITDSEAGLLNDINNFHSDFAFGNAIFIARKDYIVLLEDVQEFYTFIEMCYKALLFNNNKGLKEKCGFLRINSESVVPYCIKDGKKYIPLFCFEGETENLRHLTVKLENWNLAYLKFCCKVQGISDNELIISDSCTMISLDDIKNSYSTETNFEEYWPPKIVDTKLLKNQNSTHVNPPGVWVKPPLEVVISENSTIPHTSTESAPVLPQSVIVMMNSYQNERPANEMGSALSQDSSLINGAVRVVSPTPLVCVGSTAKVIGTQLLSSPSSPVPPTIQETSLHSNFGWKLTRIPERMWGDKKYTAAYKIQKALLQGRMIHCINAKPYKYSELMVTLNDLVKLMLPSCTVARCTHILHKFLKTTLFSGNSEQLAVLRENRRLRSINPEDTPMAMLQDIKHVLMQLKIFMYMQDEEIQQYQSADRPSKRHRTS